LLEEVLTSVAVADYGTDRKRGNPDNRPSNWRRVVHADVKPANIFLRKEYVYGKLPSLVLGDFGNAFVGSSHDGGGGTPTYEGPEYPFVSAKTDVWGLGAIIHNLAHGCVPMRKMPEKALALVEPLPEGTTAEQAWAMNPSSKRAKQLHTKRYSEALDSCMLRCLDLDPDVRITSVDLVDLLWKKKAMWKKKQDRREWEEEEEEAQEREKARAESIRRAQEEERREREEQQQETQGRKLLDEGRRQRKGNPKGHGGDHHEHHRSRHGRG